VFYLEPGSHRPLYEQVKENFKSLIIKGVLPENDRIPSIRELAGMLSLNPNTIQRAYKELEAEGYVYSMPGKGGFVAPADNQAKARRQADLLAEFKLLLPELWYAGVSRSALSALIEQFYDGREATP
jgi:GntR family transcriptional regulator